jgi:hypothetical protein
MTGVKFFIVTLNLATAFFIMFDVTGSGFTVHNYFTPMLFIVFLTYLIASLFLDQFTTISNTLMMCYAVDLDITDGKPEYGEKTFHEKIH